MIPIDEFVAVVRSFRGTPFGHRGRLPGVAMDCAGTVVTALAHFGEPSPDVRYGTTPSESDLVQGLSAIADRIPSEQRETGDVVVLQIGRESIHMAVLVGHDAGGRELIVHPSRRQVITEHAIAPPIVVTQCWRLRAVDHG